jgi:branched-chain amino acid transport system ATP-binding protein
VLFEGQDVTGRSPQHIAHLGIAMVPERDKVFVELTPIEHFRLTRLKTRGDFSATLDRVLGIFPDLGSHLTRRAGYLSGGQRQMLAFASALFRSPRVMLIDEFSQGLAPTIVDSLAQIVHKLQEDGITLVLVEQNVAIARSIADRLYILDAGRVVVSGTHDELSLSEVTRRYLGLADEDR